MPATLISSETELCQRHTLLVIASVSESGIAGLKLVYCWASIVDTGATLNQHRLDIPCMRELDLLYRSVKRSVVILGVCVGSAINRIVSRS